MSQHLLQFNVLSDDNNDQGNFTGFSVKNHGNSYVDSFSTTNASNLSTTYEDAQNITSDYVTIQNNEQSVGQYYQASPQHFADEQNDQNDSTPAVHTEHISVPKISDI